MRNGRPVGALSGVRLGRYQLGPLVGAGGMGEVYRARDTALRRDVAVKILAKGDRRWRRLQKEARAAAELDHPNVVAVHDLGTHAGVPYLVTELLDGVTLAELLRRGPLPRAAAIAIAVHIARAIAAAHDRGIVHRDVKPGNVFVCRDGRVKLLDFGLAVRRATSRRDDSRRSVEGTPAYMSPEQVRGERTDARADLFALGLILYEALTGRRAFDGHDSTEVGHAIVTRDPEPLDDPALAAVVSRCLVKDPARRFQSAHDLAFVLETLGSAAVRGAHPRREYARERRAQCRHVRLRVGREPTSLPSVHARPMNAGTVTDG